MVGKKRVLRPQSQAKLAASIAATLAGRLGAVVETPLGGYLVTSLALQSASDWYQRRSIANTIFKTALGKLGAIPPMDHAKVNALASAASKVIIDVQRGVINKPAEDLLEDALEAANARIGAPDNYVQAVKDAALAYLGQIGAEAA